MKLPRNWQQLNKKYAILFQLMAVGQRSQIQTNTRVCCRLNISTFIEIELKTKSFSRRRIDQNACYDGTYHIIYRSNFMASNLTIY
jgi:hypothetical protein